MTKQPTGRIEDMRPGGRHGRTVEVCGLAVSLKAGVPGPKVTAGDGAGVVRGGVMAEGMIADGNGKSAMASGAADRWSPVGPGRHRHGWHQGL